MKLWIRKISVILITFMTLGVYIPPTYLNTNAEETNEAVSSEADVIIPVAEINEEEIIEDEPDDFISLLTKQAKEQTMTKLGPKIVQQVDDEFTSVILPEMEKVLNNIVEKAEESSPYLAITEEPAHGYGEKIFNIYDYQTKKDIVRFDVRREKRPLEGYWFNFHYHVSSDDFEEHHPLGEIYWDKNIPPKWMS
ncbi:YpjP family protein [Virgibacillus necropolis]|uniref:YpjP-like protein n=1 Tax=Virgibacillus necropolis TaxID=163877 RepID=A0A221M8A1_9BACI|nr:YpjP family protein [Virgibacillus necropolis]ASN03886.1 hypothetical protein CFK40_02150 [Virgibacillus necropolis]